MATFFLLIIYLAFISLGLPDSLLGVAWPLIQSDYGSPFEAAGLISMFTAGGTIVSSFSSGAVHKHLSTGRITLISCLMTAFSLLGFAYSQSFVWLLVLAVPLGLGGGSVDAALNNYVANHYKAHHMSWLHCFCSLFLTISQCLALFWWDWAVRRFSHACSMKHLHVSARPVPRQSWVIRWHWPTPAVPSCRQYWALSPHVLPLGCFPSLSCSIS